MSQAELLTQPVDVRRGTVLVVEDVAPSAELMASIVEEEGFRSEIAVTASAALECFSQVRHVAVLIDWVLPDRPGIEICREIRAQDRLIPIIFVSGRDDEASITRGLDAGADDYIVKPVRRTELVARLEAHLRKAAASQNGRPLTTDAAPAPGTRFGDVELDATARTVRVAGHEISLGHREFDLLIYLAQHPGVALSREDIVAHVYGPGAPASTERVDLLVRRLRMKLGPGPRRGALVVAVPGFGYRLERRTTPR
jgi:two-component system response regulator VicR